MAIPDSEEQDPIVTIGSVSWQFKSGGYVSGLDEIEPLIDVAHGADPYNANMIVLYMRTVAIATKRLEDGRAMDRQYTVDSVGARVREDGMLTEEQISYIHKQFGFDGDAYRKKMSEAGPKF